jgi:hypothetical protein
LILCWLRHHLLPAETGFGHYFTHFNDAAAASFFVIVANSAFAAHLCRIDVHLFALSTIFSLISSNLLLLLPLSFSSSSNNL